MLLIAHPVQVSRYFYRRGSHTLELNKKVTARHRASFSDQHQERQLVHVKIPILISATKHHSDLNASRN